MLPWGNKVSHYLVQVDMPSKSFEGSEEEYRWECRIVWIHNIAGVFWNFFLNPYKYIFSQEMQIYAGVT